MRVDTLAGEGKVVCFFAVSAKAKFGFDDSLDVVGIHGVMGMRLDEDAEVEGMDSTEHSETACNY